MDPGIEHCLNQCDLTTEAQRNKFVSQFGISTIQDFILFDENDLNKITSQ